MPTYESILSGEYALSRTSFLYVKYAHLDAIPAVRAYLVETYSEAAMGEMGYLTLKGLISLSEPQRQAVLAKL